ncbi:MAG: tyrosine--tRNA ligase [Candidatus Sericytochromatia bacterium]|nr:MAG: tyrosine--tRNA ligase [Candidatus Sericytochromatia bacterium]
MSNFIEELKWRNMLSDIMPGTEEQLNKEMTLGYIGFDPSSDSLGVGNLVQVMTLLRFQNSGHKPIALVGGATGLIGDPSGKSAERNLLSKDEIIYNQECQLKQLKKFLDFDCGKNSAEIVNNYDWFKDYKFLDFIRDIGKHITINYMLSKDSVKLRLESGMSFTEFSYQLIQGYDFYYLYKNKGVKLQMGGSDQWGNIVTGTELIRKLDNGQGYAVTTHLIKKSDGTKFGKTESGNLWLDPRKTSPYKFYQFWINASDDDVKTYIRYFTLKSKEEIESLELEHDKAPHLRLLQKTLAEDVTLRVHGKDELEKSIKASQVLFGDSPIEELKNFTNSEILDIFEGVPHFNMSRVELDNGINILDLLVKSGVYPSKSEARRSIQQNALKINKNKFNNVNEIINLQYLVNNRFILLQKGKKNYYLIVVE